MASFTDFSFKCGKSLLNLFNTASTLYIFFFLSHQAQGILALCQTHTLHTLHSKAKIQIQDHQDSPYDLT